MPYYPQTYYPTATTTCSNNTTWRLWATDSTTSSHQLVWQDWNTTTTTSSYNTVVVWEDWNSVRYSLSPQVGWDAGRDTPRMRQPRYRHDPEAERQRQAEADKLVQERHDAYRRAEELLKSCLDEEQLRELEEEKKFHVVAASGRRYCIHRGVAGNVTRVDIDSVGGSQSEKVRTFCCHLSREFPEPDHMLAQKLAIETDEDAFLLVANMS